MCYALCNSILVFSRLNWWTWISLWTIVSLCYHRAEISIDQSTGPDIIHFSHGGPYVKCGQTPLPFIFWQFGWDRTSQQPKQTLWVWRSSVIRLRMVPYFLDMSGWTSGHIFSGKVHFFPDIDWGTSSGDFENCTEPTTHVFHCFSSHTHYKWYS